MYFAGGYVIASRNPRVARADAATPEGLQAIAENARDWMLTVASQIVAILLTVGGLGVLAKTVPNDVRTAPTVSAALFTAGAALMLVYLGFHLFITPHPPGDYEEQRRRYARLYRVYAVAAYAAFLVLGWWFVKDDAAPSWAGWFLIGTGAAGLGTAIARRPRIADVPLWMHLIAGVLGVALLAR